MSEINKLIDDVTILGAFKDKKGKKFQIRYGNKVHEILPNGEVSEKSSKIPEDIYQKYLDKYMKSIEKKINLMNTQKEIQNNNNEQNQQNELLEKNIAEKKHLENEVQNLQSIVKNQQSEIAEKQRKINEIEQNKAYVQTQLEYQIKQLTEEKTILEQQTEEVEAVEAKNKKRHLVDRTLIVLTLISVLASSGFVFFTSMNHDSETNNKAVDKLTLYIDGEEYNIEKSQVELAEGESNISIYALRVTNKDGKQINDVIPLGELKLSADTQENNSTEAPVSTEEPVEQ